MLDSGVLEIWRGSNVAPAGSMPVMKYAQIFESQYEDRTVGVTRWYAAKRNGDRADYLVRINRNYGISAASDLVVLRPFSHLDGDAYKIDQIQQVLDDDGIWMTDLMLERVEGLDAATIAGTSGGTE